MKIKWRNFIFAFLTLASYSLESETRAHHHKVHNLALFPERHSWCQAQPIRQEISAQNPECQPLTIDNVVCLGACFSYSVPRAQDDAVIPPYCDACRPTKSSWTTVALNCTKADTHERYPVLKDVELISNCSCVDCSQRNGEAEGLDNDSEEALTESKESKTAVDVIDLEEEEADDEDVIDIPGLDPSTLHKLKSASAELKGIPKGAEELMIKDNKITPDDDDDDRRHGSRHKAL